MKAVYLRYIINPARKRSINSLRPSDAYMRQKTSHHWVQRMACPLDGAKPLSEPMPEYCNLTLRNKLQWNFNRYSNIFIQENPFQNVVWKIAAILSRPQCVIAISSENSNLHFHHYCKRCDVFCDITMSGIICSSLKPFATIKSLSTRHVYFFAKTIIKQISLFPPSLSTLYDKWWWYRIC